MHILVVGLNHRTAPVEVREKFAFHEHELGNALRKLEKTKSILECVIVSTCNRTEIYAVVDRLHPCGGFIRDYLENWFQVPRSEFVRHLYIYEDDQATEHLFRVTSGLDSMIIGETQILGQVRGAFLMAQDVGTTGTFFNTLFKRAITMAKKAHSETGIADNAVSVSYAAIELGKQIFGDFLGKTVMIVGAGKMSELTVKHLYANGAGKVIVVNRTPRKAKELAGKFNGTHCSLDRLDECLREVDIIISSTGSPGIVLTHEKIQTALRKNKSSRPLFMIDIAVPRDIDPAVNDLPNVYLYDIDDLQGIVESNLEQRRKEADKIREMIAVEMESFEEWYRTLGVGPVIRALQEKSAAIHEEIMGSMQNKLPDLTEREMKVIRKLSKSIVNQVLHDPIARVKEKAAEKNGQEALHLFTEIFALEERLQELEEEQTVAKVEKKRDEKKENKASQFTVQPHEMEFAVRS